MSKSPWTDLENDLIVADYFAMLSDELADRPFNKSEHRRQLVQKLGNRSESSVEFKHQNISAVLKGLGEIWISGYRPAFNFQMTLVDAVVRWMLKHPEWETRLPTIKRYVLGERPSLFLGPAPTLSNQLPPEELDQMQLIASKFDVAKRDERNRRLGHAGEELLLEHERSTLRNNGKPELAERVRWISQEDGDGIGYDIESYELDGKKRLIEVKTTNGWERTPFYITRSELAAAEQNRDDWCLVRLWNFAKEPKAFEIRPPLDRHVSLTAQTYRASFH